LGLDVRPKSSWILLSGLKSSVRHSATTAIEFPTPAETVYPLNVAPPSGTTRANLEITPKESLLQMSY
jgi:hypothetical protein